jgi:hypothetical protein
MRPAGRRPQTPGRALEPKHHLDQLLLATLLESIRSMPSWIETLGTVARRWEITKGCIVSGFVKHEARDNPPFSSIYSDFIPSLLLSG